MNWVKDSLHYHYDYIDEDDGNSFALIKPANVVIHVTRFDDSAPVKVTTSFRNMGNDYVQIQPPYENIAEINNKHGNTTDGDSCFIYTWEVNILGSLGLGNVFY